MDTRYIKQVAWTAGQAARVKEIFGDDHVLYGLALSGSADLVHQLEQAVRPDYELEALLQQMSSSPTRGADREFDQEKAKVLFGKLQARQLGRELLRSLKEFTDYRRFIERTRE